MDFYLLRNAKAAKDGKANDDNDDDRPLTKKGERKIIRVAEAMRDLELKFDAIITSPLLRATHSAEVVARSFRMKDSVHHSSHLAPHGNPALLVNEINAKHGDTSGLLLVGHEPSLGALISILLVGDNSLQMIFKRGGLCKLSVENLCYGKCASLCWLMAPSQLKRM